jgi:hypothetical protein
MVFPYLPICINLFSYIICLSHISVFPSLSDFVCPATSLKSSLVLLLDMYDYRYLYFLSCECEVCCSLLMFILTVTQIEISILNEPAATRTWLSLSESTEEFFMWTVCHSKPPKTNNRDVTIWHNVGTSFCGRNITLCCHEISFIKDVCINPLFKKFYSNGTLLQEWDL